MTEAYAVYPQIESMARAHWWHRVKDTYAQEHESHVLQGRQSDVIEQAWNETRLDDCTAMAKALNCITLRDMIAMAE